VKQLALAAIQLYQRYLSPRKGFCCAYRTHSGRASCSNLGYRAIRRFGLWRGVTVLRQRLAKCGIAYRRHHRPFPTLGQQAGFCDLPCDLPCDLSCDGNAGNFTCDLPCSDWWSERKNEEEERQVHLPESPR
jgi:uncharacterized protein